MGTVNDDETRPNRLKTISGDSGGIVISLEERGCCSDEDDKVAAASSKLHLVDLLVHQVLEGQWDESLSLLCRIGPLDEKTTKSASLLVLEQKYYEFWNEGMYLDALNTAMSQVRPLCENDDPVLEQMAFFLAYIPEELEKLHYKPGTGKLRLESRKRFLSELRKSKLGSRQMLLDELRKLVYPTVSVSHGHACKFHSCLASLEGHRDHVSVERLQMLQEHEDKICFLQFSHSGKYLASSSSDCLVIVWEVAHDGCVSLKHRLSGHQKPVFNISWSPGDGNQLLTCGADEVVRRWDAASGQCLHVYEKSGLGLISCVWAPDGNSLFTGINDKSICLWDVNGKELKCWKGGMRALGIADLGISSNGERVIYACEENLISICSWESLCAKFITEDQTISSFSMSHDGKLLLVSLLNGEFHLWSVDGFAELFATYKGHKCCPSLARPCFGGSGNAFIASGSEDSQVYIWDRQSEKLIAMVAGHNGVVSCVSWNPSVPYMLASGGHDRTICIWRVNQGNVNGDG